MINPFVKIKNQKYILRFIQNLKLYSRIGDEKYFVKYMSSNPIKIISVFKI